MSLSCRQQRLLRGLDDAVSRSDPRLASMLAIFGQLTAGEEMPDHDQVRTPLLSRLRAALRVTVSAAAALITGAARACARGLHSAARACTAVASGRRPPAGCAASPGSPAAGTRGGVRPDQRGLSRP